MAPAKFPLSISTGFTALNWYLAACVFAGTIGSICHETWGVPEILGTAPMLPEELGRIAHHPIRRKLILAFAASLLATAAVFVIYAAACARRGLTFHAGWAFPAAAAFWLQLIGIAGALPGLRHLRLRPKTAEIAGPSPIKTSFMIGVVVVFVLSLIAMALAPLALDGKWGPEAAELGKVCHQILAPSGLLLWPTQPSAVPWWQLILTMLLIIAALPSISWVWAVFRVPPVVTPDINDYWMPSCSDDWEDEEDPSPRDNPGEAKPPLETSLSGKFNVPSPAAGLSENGRRELADRLRQAMDDLGGESDLLFVPRTANLRERWPKMRWAWLMILLPVFAGVAWGNVIGLMVGWVWLSVHAMTVPRSDAPFCQAFFEHYHGPAPHRQLPISLNPTWRALSRHHRNTMMAFFITAVLFPLAGWLVCLMADLPGTLWPWRRHGFQGLEFHHLTATAAVVIATAGVMLRALGPANFGNELNNRRDLCGGWQFFGSIVWSAAFAGIAATAVGSWVLIAMVFGYGPIQTMPVLLPPLLALACYAAGEGFRRLSLGLVFWQWFHAGKR